MFYVLISIDSLNIARKGSFAETFRWKERRIGSEIGGIRAMTSELRFFFGLMFEMLGYFMRFILRSRHNPHKNKWKQKESLSYVVDVEIYKHKITSSNTFGTDKLDLLRFDTENGHFHAEMVAFPRRMILEVAKNDEMSAWIGWNAVSCLVSHDAASDATSASNFQEILGWKATNNTDTSENTHDIGKIFPKDDENGRKTRKTTGRRQKQPKDDENGQKMTKTIKKTPARLKNTQRKARNTTANTTKSLRLTTNAVTQCQQNTRGSSRFHLPHVPLAFRWGLPCSWACGWRFRRKSRSAEQLTVNTTKQHQIRALAIGTRTWRDCVRATISLERYYVASVVSSWSIFVLLLLRIWRARAGVRVVSPSVYASRRTNVDKERLICGARRSATEKVQNPIEIAARVCDIVGAVYCYCARVWMRSCAFGCFA